MTDFGKQSPDDPSQIMFTAEANYGLCGADLMFARLAITSERIDDRVKALTILVQSFNEATARGDAVRNGIFDLAVAGERKGCEDVVANVDWEGIWECSTIREIHAFRAGRNAAIDAIKARNRKDTK